MLLLLLLIEEEEDAAPAVWPFVEEEEVKGEGPQSIEAQHLLLCCNTNIAIAIAVAIAI